ncbi:sigma-54-dependent Fis family transcriptional regulator, partial [Morganella morganii]|uniref:sigma 54-interacting transcriptional regulator n=1 Tax=Morganella morganii TaxID=582 RepID=UPI0009C4E1D7
AINCAAIPEQLLESELFGYVKGAFTGASANGKQGLIQAADKGTLFLDEIGDMPLIVQAKLLRAIESREVQPIGSSRTIPVDIRIVSATNQNLEQFVSEGKFREDLYYCLNVIPISLPPLRERHG